MKNLVMLAAGAALMVSAMAQAGIKGDINGEFGSNNTNSGVNIGSCINGKGNNNGGAGCSNIQGSNNQKSPAAKDKNKDNSALSSICSSPFMKKYAAICQ